MNHLSMKKIATVVLFTFLFAIISPAYTFSSYNVSRTVNQIESSFEKGDYDKSLELIDDFINKYADQKEEYKEEFCMVYYIRAKIFLDLEDKNEMNKALLDLYLTDHAYELPPGEDREFVKNANEIKRAVELKMESDKNKLKDENEEKKIRVTFEISNISDGVLICIDELNSDQAKPLKENKVELEVEPGRHRFYFILKGKGKVLSRDYTIKEKIYYQFPLNFASGHDIKSLPPSDSYPGQNVIEKLLSKKEKKKRFPVMLVVTGVTVGVAIALLIKQKIKKSSGLSNFITDKEGIHMYEGETATFQVKLSHPPQNNINVTVTRQSGDNNISVESGQSLIFTPFNWDSSQEVAIKAEEDPDTEDDKATIRISANGFQNKDIVVYAKDTGNSKVSHK